MGHTVCRIRTPADPCDDEYRVFTLDVALLFALWGAATTAMIVVE